MKPIVSLVTCVPLLLLLLHVNIAHTLPAIVPVVSEEALGEIEDIIKEEIVNNLIRADLGTSPECAADSCKQIGELNPTAGSDYYWIKGIYGPFGAFCEFQGFDGVEASGGWMRVIDMNMTREDAKCLTGLKTSEIEGKKLCERPERVVGCTSTNIPVSGIEHSKVCGQVVGYQFGSTGGFGPSRSTGAIGSTYIDGVSVTHGSPRHHIWSFASAPHEVEGIRPHAHCPCLFPNVTFTGIIPSIVGSDYYCDTGSRSGYEVKYYLDDPLWDGKGCENDNACCERGGPWFCKELSEMTTDDIELRICMNNVNEDVGLEVIELYVQ